MSDDIGIGSLVPFERPRDAVHIAVIPVQAADELQPGWQVEIDEAGWAFKARTGTEAVGVVDPFLRFAVKKGERFWLLLFPGTIRSLRHEWGHPRFPLRGPITTAEQQAASINWLFKFAAENGVDYEELVAGAVTGQGVTFNADHHGPIGVDDDIDPVEFWRHVETVTGIEFSQAHRTGTYFGCSC